MAKHTYFFKAETNGKWSWKTTIISGLVTANTPAEAYNEAIEQIHSILVKEHNDKSDDFILTALNRLD